MDPPYDNTAPVFIMTGDTLGPEVLNPDKEFIIFFTDNSVPKLLFFRALMYEFAERYENVTDVVFGELDQADNEPDGVGHPNLPHLIYYPKGESKVPI